MSGNPYRDKRQEFFQQYYERALPYEGYLATGQPVHVDRWRSFEKEVSLSAADRKILETFRRKMPVLVLSGTWCGDCARQGPMLKLLEEECPLLSFRFIDNRENPELQDELRINGAEKVPVIVAFSEDFYEVGRFGDRHLSVYRRKVVSELGPVCDPGILPPPQKELHEELCEWVFFFERMQHMLRLSPALRRRYND